MRPQTLRQAMMEARKFLAAGEVCLDSTRTYGNVEIMSAGKDSGALRRASMELTRALAKLRGGK